METIKLELNQRLEILWEEHVYCCTVQEEVDGKPVISIPVYRSQYLTLKDGEIVDAVYYDKNNGVYGFIIKIEGRTLENSIPCYVVSKPINVKRIQRREYVRVDLLESIRFIKNLDTKDEDAVNGTILDVSGGGVRLQTTEKLEISEKIICLLNIDDEVVDIAGRIVRKEEDVEKFHMYGVEFENVLDRVRDRVIKKVFLQMRKQRELC